MHFTNTAIQKPGSNTILVIPPSKLKIQTSPYHASTELTSASLCASSCMAAYRKRIKDSVDDALTHSHTATLSLMLLMTHIRPMSFPG